MKERRRGRPKGTKKRKTTLLPSAVKTSDALFSIWSALETNPKQLAERLRKGDASKAEMALAADLIEGIIKPRRPRSSREDRFEIAKWVAQFEKSKPTWQRKKVISVVADFLGRDQPLKDTFTTRWPSLIAKLSRRSTICPRTTMSASSMLSRTNSYATC